MEAYQVCEGIRVVNAQGQGGAVLGQPEVRHEPVPGTYVNVVFDHAKDRQPKLVNVKLLSEERWPYAAGRPIELITNQDALDLLAGKGVKVLDGDGNVSFVLMLHTPGSLMEQQERLGKPMSVIHAINLTRRMGATI